MTPAGKQIAFRDDHQAQIPVERVFAKRPRRFVEQQREIGVDTNRQNLQDSAPFPHLSAWPVFTGPSDVRFQYHGAIGMPLSSISRALFTFALLALICSRTEAQPAFPDTAPLDTFEESDDEGQDDWDNSIFDSLPMQQQPFGAPGNPGLGSPGNPALVPPGTPGLPANPGPHASQIGEPPAPRMYNPANIRSDFFGVVNTIPLFPGTSLVGRQKIAENNSPIPRDRFFINYSYFDSAGLIPGGVDVHRFTPGFEKTFMNGWMSVEARVPMAITLNSTDFTDTSHAELGNLNVNLKGIIFQRWDLLASAGLGVTVPTADDVRVGGVTFENSAVHLLPFVGAIYQPNERFFTQGFAQIDVDINGNTVTGFGGYDDPTLLYLDWQAGYWLYRCLHTQKPVGYRRCNTCNTGPSRLHVTGIAPSIEFHYTRSLDDRDSTGLSVLNGSVGATVELSNDSTLDVGYVFPIGGTNDQQFDGELRVMFNYFFPTRRHRTARATPYRVSQAYLAGRRAY